MERNDSRVASTALALTMELSFRYLCWPLLG